MGLFSSPYDNVCKKAIKAGDSGDLERSCDLFLEAVQMDSQKPLGFAGLGLTYQKVAGYLADDNPERKEYAEMSLRAFDEAVRLQQYPDLKAEYLWLKGVTFTLLGRVAEADAAWSQANNILPGSVEAKKAKSSWLVPRICKTCKKTFTLCDHGHPGAWATAEEERSSNKQGHGCDYFALSECPVCKRVTVEAALREAMQSVVSKKQGGP